MSDKATSEDLLVRYLLGQMSEEEGSRVEERFMRDGEYYEQLLVTEDELRCAYAKGTLADAERKQFEKRFLMFPDEREKVELARAMIAELSGISVEPAPETVIARRAQGTEHKGLLALLGFGSARMRFAMAAAALVVLAAFAWMAIETSRLRKQVSQLEARQTEREKEFERRSGDDQSRTEQLNRELEDERTNRTLLEQELAQLREQPSPDNEARPAIISILLAPGRIRGGGETKKLTIREASAQARLLLNIGDKSGYGSYQAVILNSEGAQVWSRRGLRASKARGAQFVVLRIPARLLGEDDYEINLKGLPETGEYERVGDYHFTVLKM